MKGKTSFLNGQSVMMSNNVMAIVYKKSVMGINTDSGNTVLSKEYDKDINVIISNNNGDKLFVGTEKS